jgi:hypothetical protein
MCRLVQAIRRAQPPTVTLRIETEPGEVGQVDFGFIGYLRDDQTGASSWITSRRRSSKPVRVTTSRVCNRPIGNAPNTMAF